MTDILQPLADKLAAIDADIDRVGNGAAAATLSAQNTARLLETVQGRIDALTAAVELLKAPQPEPVPAPPIPDEPAGFWDNLRPAPPGVGIRQIGPWLDYIESPFNNQAYEKHPTAILARLSWSSETLMDYDQLVAEGYIDRWGWIYRVPIELADPTRPNNLVSIAIYNSGISADRDRPGDYELTWTGDPNAKVSVWNRGDIIRSNEPGRIAFTIPEGAKETDQVYPFVTDAGDVNAFGPVAVTVNKIDAPDSIYRPAKRDEYSDYHVIRFLDQVGIVGKSIRDVSEATPLGAPYWGERWPIPALFEAANEVEAAAWVPMPPRLGVPDDLAWDLEILEAEKWSSTTDLRRRDLVEPYAEDILASTAWDDYADALVEGMNLTDYPTDRLAIFEVGNEVIFNTFSVHGINTSYVAGIGDGLVKNAEIRVPASYDRDSIARAYGYGRLIARSVGAISDAFDRAGHPHHWRFAAMGFAWSPWTTGVMIDAIDDGLAERADAEALRAKIGLTLNGYYYGVFSQLRFGTMYGEAATTPEQIKAYADRLNTEAATDFDDWARRATDYYIADRHPQLLRALTQTADLAKGRGMDFMGLYEGGPHDELDPALKAAGVTDATHRRYHLHEERDRAEAALEARFHAAFPDAIWANYAGRQAVFNVEDAMRPWSDGGGA